MLANREFCVLIVAITTIANAVAGLEDAKSDYQQWIERYMRRLREKSSFPNETSLTREFHGTSYAILTWTNEQGIKEYKTLDHAEAAEACQDYKHHGSIVAPISEEETKFLVKWLFDELKIHTPVWLNLQRVTERNEFFWQDTGELLGYEGEVCYKNWHKCEPNDDQKPWPETCVEMYSNVYPYPLKCDVEAKAGQWNDVACTQISRLVVCQSHN